METRSFFAIIPDSLWNEFDLEVKKLEEKHQLVRGSDFVSKGNKFQMTGNTHKISYEKGGKYKSFTKELRVFWGEFNNKHPKTTWKGK